MSAAQVAAGTFDDFTDAAITPLEGDNMAILHALAAEYIAADKNVAEAEAALAVAKLTFKDIAEQRLPDFMETHGLTDGFKHRDPASGVQTIIAYRDTNVASIEVKNRPAAFAWFRSVGKGGIIKKVLAADVGKEDDSVVIGITDAIKAAAPGLEVAVAESIHTQTLGATVREMLRDGKTIDDSVTVARLREAKVTIK